MLEHHGFHAGVRILEVDQVFDRNGELRAADKLLRLRQAGADWILTYKGPAERGVHKSRQEIEMPVPDAEALIEILTGLGFAPAFRYEKYRTKFKPPAAAGNIAAIVALDETPIGVFLELEGPGYWIDETAMQLGFTTADYVIASYASLYNEHRRTHPAVPSDMRFY
jgi:adenylate cyclase class 2